MPPRNIILATIGSAGDVNPMIAIGRALQDQGHQVTVVTSPFFAEYVQEAGLPFSGLRLAVDYEGLIDDPDMWHPQRAFFLLARRVILPLLRPFYELLADADPATTTVVGTALLLGGHIAREKLGLTHVTLHLQPSLLRSVYRVPSQGGVHIPEWAPRWLKHLYWRIVDRVVDGALAAGVNDFRAELDLPPAHQLFGDWLHSPHRNLGLFPPWFAPPQPDWPASTLLTGFVRYDAADQMAMSEELRDFLALGEPPLVFTAGTANLQGERFFRESALAAQRLGRRAVLLSHFPEQIPRPLPPQICYAAYAPFSQLLPRAAALIYHGGIGTLAQALGAGIPHLVMPMSYDQPDNAARLEALGVGASLSPRRYRARAVARTLELLLDDPAVSRRCHELAQRVDFAAGLQAACRAIATAHLNR